MLTLSIQSIVTATVEILLLGLAGYLLVKAQTLDENGLQLLTRLLINFFLPVFFIYQYSQNFSFHDFPDWWVYPLLGLAIVVIGFAVGAVCLVLIPQFSFKKGFLSLVCFQNSGYLPFIIINTLFEGQEAHALFLKVILLLIGFNLSIWSFGFWLLSDKKKEEFDIRRALKPPLVTMTAMLVVVYFGLQQWIPTVFIKPLGMFSGCLLPIAMIVIGGNLACINIREASWWPLSLVMLAKLIFVPLVTLWVIVQFSFEKYMGFVLLLEAIVPSVVSLSIIARYHQTDTKFINQGIFYTHILSVLTMPVWLMVYGKIFGN